MQNACDEEFVKEEDTFETLSGVISNTKSVTTALPIDSYTFTKRLSVNQDILNAQADAYISQFQDSLSSCYVDPSAFTPKVAVQSCLTVCHLCVIDYGVDVTIYDLENPTVPISVASFLSYQNDYVEENIEAIYSNLNVDFWYNDDGELQWNKSSLNIFDVKQNELWLLEEFNQGYSYTYTQEAYEAAQREYVLGSLDEYFELSENNDTSSRFSYDSDNELKVPSNLTHQLTLIESLESTYKQEFKESIATCEVPCDRTQMTFDGCDINRDQLLVDMSPLGQYGLNIEDNDNSTLISSPLSIFNENNELPINRNVNADSYISWRTPFGGNYKNSDGTVSKIEILTINNEQLPAYTGVTFLEDGKQWIYPQQLTSVFDFIDYWQPSWAESLIQYHPEYKYLEYLTELCEVTNLVDVFNVYTRVPALSRELNSDEYDSYIQQVESYATAVEIGLLVVEDNYDSTGKSLFDQDPYFKQNIPNVNDDITKRRGIMQYALTTMYEYFGGKADVDGEHNSVNMLEAAYFAVTTSGINDAEASEYEDMDTVNIQRK